jgi:glutathione S-transferase
MKLYYSKNLNPRVAVCVARHLESPVEYVAASPRHPDHEEAFRPLNPNTLVPVLVEDDGRILWETDAVALRLSQLAGSDFWPGGHRGAEVMMWVSWSAHHFTQAGGTFYFERLVRPHIFTREEDAAALAQADVFFRKFAGILDQTLADRTWLVDGRLTYADFRVATCLPFAEAAGMPTGGFRHIARWHGQLRQIEAWRDPFAGLDTPPPTAAAGTRGRLGQT